MKNRNDDFIVVEKARTLLPGLIVGALAILFAAGCGGESRERVPIGGPPPRPYYDLLAKMYDGTPYALTAAEFPADVVWAGRCARKNPATDADCFLTWGAALVVSPTTKAVTLLGSAALPPRAFFERDEAAIRAADRVNGRDLLERATLADAPEGGALPARSTRSRAVSDAIAIDLALKKGETRSGSPIVLVKGTCSNPGGCRLGPGATPIPEGQAMIHCVLTRNRTSPSASEARGEREIEVLFRRQ